MKNIFYKKRLASYFTVLAVAFLVPLRAGAQVWKEATDGVVGSLAQIIVSVLGWIMQKTIALVITLAQYDNFVRNTQVLEAWGMVRDICNMFFVLILLFIAFAVILRMESYSIKKSLPKLLIMAILINFSKTICGILIDGSQIVMLTFVSAFTGAQGNFHNALQIDEFLRAVASADYTKMDATDAATYYIVAVLFMIVATVTMIAILVAFLMRIVMFWIYIVLSPLAFLLSSFSAGQKYASQYWGEFTKYLVSGPVLAFFIWMSLSVLASLDTVSLGDTFAKAPVGILQGENFAAFIMAIGMLVGGLIISAQVGGVGASWGANTVSSLKNKGIGATKAIGKRVSGYDAVADRTKSYLSMRKTARDDRIRTDVGKISGVVGATKEKMAALPKMAWRATGGRPGVAAKKLDEEIRQDRGNIDENIANIKNKKEFTDRNTNTKYSYDEENESWRTGKGASTRAVTDEDLNKNVIGAAEGKLAEKEADKSKLNNWQNYIDRGAKLGMAGAGGVAGVLSAPSLLGLPGAIMAAVYGAGVGGVGVPSVAKSINEAGKTDKNLLSGYEASQVQKESDDLKDKKTDEVRSIMDDSTKNSFARMAAALQLIARKETNVKEVEKMRTGIASKFQDKTKSTFEGAVAKNYMGASDLFDFENNPGNKNKVQDGFENGSYILKELDTNTLTKCGQQIADGMKPTTFKKQFSDLPDTKKAVTTESLEKADSYTAREKLARIKTIDKAFGPRDDEKKKYTKKLNIKIIQEIISEGNQEQRESLAKNIVTNNEIDDRMLADDIAKTLKNKGITSSKAIRSSLGIDDKEK